MPPTPRDLQALRNDIAEAIRRSDFREWSLRRSYTAADEVLGVVAADRATTRAAALHEAADVIGSEDDCGCGGCDACVLNKRAADLRRMADEITAN
ncbi:hypothetical protein [Streptomyces albogriseolus]|uniref:hypothetical protein n=1 Tax=Streptomyces albogriseolus TaxID=1887 RepID=UPI003CE760A4